MREAVEDFVDEFLGTLADLWRDKWKMLGTAAAFVAVVAVVLALVALAAVGIDALNALSKAK